MSDRGRSLNRKKLSSSSVFCNKNPINQRLSDRRRRVYPDRFWESGAGSRTRTQLLSQSGLSAPGRESELQGPTDNPSHQLLLKRPLKSLDSAWSFRGPSSSAASKDSWVLLSIHSPLHRHPTSQRWIPKRWNKLQLRAPLQTARGTVRKCGSDRLTPRRKPRGGSPQTPPVRSRFKGSRCRTWVQA